MELTKEYFDQKISQIFQTLDDVVANMATKQEVAELKTELKGDIATLQTSITTLQTEIAQVQTDVDRLARMTANRFDALEKDLNVRKEVLDLNVRMLRIERALDVHS